MSSHSDEPFLPTEPALIVTVGNTARKHRSLKRPVVVLGRAHGCDIGLSAPDISSVHCVIYQGPSGLCLRDCQSRSGTHLNGQPITEEVLHDGDTIQVGPFSFQAYIPLTFVGPAASECAPRVEHLGRSRARLARLALNLRRRLREDRASGDHRHLSAAERAEREAELDRQAEFLRKKAAEYEQRARRLEEAERALAGDRAKLEREAAEHQDRLAQTQRELAHGQAALEQQLDIRRRELDCLARHLGGLRQRLQNPASEGPAGSASSRFRGEDHCLRDLLALPDPGLAMFSGEPEATARPAQSPPAPR